MQLVGAPRVGQPGWACEHARQCCTPSGGSQAYALWVYYEHASVEALQDPPTTRRQRISLKLTRVFCRGRGGGGVVVSSGEQQADDAGAASDAGVGIRTREWEDAIYPPERHWTGLDYRASPTLIYMPCSNPSLSPNPNPDVYAVL